MMKIKNVGVLGATSLVGQFVLPLLKTHGWKVIAFSRQKMGGVDADIEWVPLLSQMTPADPVLPDSPEIPCWICMAPLWVLPDFLPLLERCGARRVVALSSTSLFTKIDSTHPEEKETVRKLAMGEKHLAQWAKKRAVDWVILRPTLIYGGGQDKNISQIARLIRRFGFFPLLGQANGLRQPVHAEDVADACVSALEAGAVANRAYNLPGGETLSYREMVFRVFMAVGRRPRLLAVPSWVWRILPVILSVHPRYRHWNAQMARRMNEDMVFNSDDAGRDLNYTPRPFRLTIQDLPSQRKKGSHHEL